MYRVFIILRVLIVVAFAGGVNAHADVSMGNVIWIQLAVDKAHEKGFIGCDVEIRQVYHSARGESFRVDGFINDSAPDYLSMVSSWTDRGESVLLNSTYYYASNRCIYSTNTVITTDEKCSEYSQRLEGFSYTTKIGDTTWMDNGRVVVFLKDYFGCVVTFNYSGNMK